MCVFVLGFVGAAVG